MILFALKMLSVLFLFIELPLKKETTVYFMQRLEKISAIHSNCWIFPLTVGIYTKLHNYEVKPF